MRRTSSKNVRARTNSDASADGSSTSPSSSPSSPMRPLPGSTRSGTPAQTTHNSVSPDTKAEAETRAGAGPEAKLLAKLQAQRKADDASSSSFTQTKRPVLQASALRAQPAHAMLARSPQSTPSAPSAPSPRALQRRPSQRTRAIRFAKFMRHLTGKRSPE